VWPGIFARLHRSDRLPSASGKCIYCHRWNKQSALIYTYSVPIYEYRSIKGGCAYCKKGFDVIQKMSEKPLTVCPKCGAEVRKALSRFRACVVETPEEAASTEKQIRGYEEEGQWSHAAELADKKGLNDRAMDNYRKAGYNF
jgi:putative FmdB family regulatory protein